jgi:hypothetical protein
MKGVVRNCDKQMVKETQLRLHNITPKAALKYGSENWILGNKKEHRIFQAAQTKFLREILGMTILDKIRNPKIKARINVKYTPWSKVLLEKPTSKLCS